MLLESAFVRSAVQRLRFPNRQNPLKTSLRWSLFAQCPSHEKIDYSFWRIGCSPVRSITKRIRSSRRISSPTCQNLLSARTAAERCILVKGASASTRHHSAPNVVKQSRQKRSSFGHAASYSQMISRRNSSNVPNAEESYQRARGYVPAGQPCSTLAIPSAPSAVIPSLHCLRAARTAVGLEISISWNAPSYVTIFTNH